jgi:hypothetical protein
VRMPVWAAAVGDAAGAAPIHPCTSQSRDGMPHPCPRYAVSLGTKPDPTTKNWGVEHPAYLSTRPPSSRNALMDRRTCRSATRSLAAAVPEGSLSLPKGIPGLPEGGRSVRRSAFVLGFGLDTLPSGSLETLTGGCTLGAHLSWASKNRSSNVSLADGGRKPPTPPAGPRMCATIDPVGFLSGGAPALLPPRFPCSIWHRRDQIKDQKRLRDWAGGH